MNFSRSFLLLFLCCGIFDFIDHNMRILCCVVKLWFKKSGEINLEKMEKFYCDFTKTFGEINFKTEKFYRDFTLHAKEPQFKIFMPWSINFKYVTT